jgi:FkbM family methyltransferase
MKGCISIGAHYGEEYEGWLSEGVENFIFFEPVMANFVKLERIMKDKPGYILLFNLAMGNIDGKIRMFTEQSHQGKSCSVLKPTGHLQQYPDIEFGTMEWCRINKLDNIPYDRELYDHLHIDTQGYELEVLRGAKESLKYINTIHIEVYRSELYEGCAMFEDIVKHLNDFALMEVFWRGNTWGDAKFKRV